jgi:hypothetical protein
MSDESAVQLAVRLEYARRGYRLFRNNNGVLKNEAGTPIRFGLANDSAPINAVIKSSDLIGWRPLFITTELLGTIIAQFVSLECKAPGWHLTPGDKRGHAQKKWLDMVAADGGFARFMTGIDE